MKPSSEGKLPEADYSVHVLLRKPQWEIDFQEPEEPMARKPKPKPLTPEEEAAQAIENERRAAEQKRQNAISAAARAYWDDRYGKLSQDGIQGSFETLYDFYARLKYEREFFQIPAFQRGIVWSHEQQVRFCETVLKNLLTASLTLWEISEPTHRFYYVIDGQQRLNALGIPLYRKGERTQCSAYLDLDGNWYPEAGPGRYTLYELCVERLEHFGSLFHGQQEDAQYRLAYLEDRITRFRFVVQRIPVVGRHGTNRDRVIEMFKTLAIPGVPMTEQDAEQWIALAQENESNE